MCSKFLLNISRGVITNSQHFPAPKNMSISKADYYQRILNLQDKLSSSEFDSLIVSEEEDIYYLTGLTYKSLERLFLLIVRKDKLSFVLPQMELAHLKHVDHVQEIKTYFEYPAKEGERWQDVLLDSLKGSQSVGMGGKAPFEIGEFLSAMSVKTGACHILDELRWVKSDKEIEMIRLAAAYSDQAVAELNAKAYFGMSELEVFSIGQGIQRKLIKETEFNYLASSVLFAAWPSRISYQPHGVPKVDDLLIEGSHISLAFLRVNGYSAELERTFFTHTPSKEQAEMFEIMLEARRRSYALLKAGVTGEEVDLAAKAFFQDEGLGKHIMHRTGHGIGLGNHEGPYLAEGDKTVLKENMVVSIEPGIYIEGVGGFRHSDTVRVTKDGYEILTHCPDDIKSLTFTQSRPFQKLKGRLIKKMFGI